MKTVFGLGMLFGAYLLAYYGWCNVNHYQVGFTDLVYPSRIPTLAVKIANGAPNGKNSPTPFTQQPTGSPPIAGVIPSGGVTNGQALNGQLGPIAPNVGQIQSSTPLPKTSKPSLIDQVLGIF